MVITSIIFGIFIIVLIWFLDFYKGAFTDELIFTIPSIILMMVAFLLGLNNFLLTKNGLFELIIVGLTLAITIFLYLKHILNNM